jgi:hypothetical protein
MAFRARLLSTAALIAGLAIAPAVHAEHWHGGGSYHHGGGNAAGAAILGGLLGLGVGAAIASNGGYYGYPGYSYGRGYYAPPYSYYGPPSAYYTPAPPPVYYGYGY